MIGSKSTEQINKKWRDVRVFKKIYDGSNPNSDGIKVIEPRKGGNLCLDQYCLK